MVELVVGMAIGTVVVGLAAVMLVATWRAQGIVTTSTQAATGGEALAGVLDRAVRTAVATSVTSADRIDLQLRNGGCESFVVTDARLYHKVTTTAGQQTGAPDASWTVLSPANDAGPMQVSQVPDPASGLKPYFAAVSGATGVTYSFRLAGAQGAVDVISTVLQRSPAGSGVSPCFS